MVKEGLVKIGRSNWVKTMRANNYDRGESLVPIQDLS